MLFAHRAGFARHLETGEARVLGRRLELTGMRADGSEFPVELTLTRTDASGAPSFTGYVRDITERKRAEEELRTTHRRLEAIAGEQGALRQVATLVAESAEPSDIFAAVCEQTGRLFGAGHVNLIQIAPDGYCLALAGWSVHDDPIGVDTWLPIDAETIGRIIQRAPMPARVLAQEAVGGELGDIAV